MGDVCGLGIGIILGGVEYFVVRDLVVEYVCECSYSVRAEVFKVDLRYVVGTC